MKIIYIKSKTNRLPLNKVYIVIFWFHVGGTERQALLLAQELVERNFEIVICALSLEGVLKRSFQKLKISIRGGGYEYDASLTKRIFFLLRFQFKLLWWIFKEKPHIVHSFLPLPNFMSSLACKIARVPCLTSWRSLINYRKKYFFGSTMDRISLSLSSAIVCNSQAVLRDIQKNDPWVSSSKTHVIYNGVIFPPDNDKFNEASLKSSLGITPKDICLVYVANLISYKGHKDLLEAFALLPLYKRKNLKLFLVGDGRTMLSELLDLTEKLNIKDRVFFLGARNDVPQILKCMDIGVMASHQEGFSNALLEKIAAGLPIVATAVGGNKEALKGLKGCRLVLPKNPIDLSVALKETINAVNTSQKTDRAERAHKIKTRFSTETMVGKYLTIYKNLKRLKSSI